MFAINLKKGGVMKVKYIGESKKAKTVKGNDVSLDKGMELDCMEKEYHSQLFVRAQLSSGEHIKIKRGDLQKT
ncbi:MAG: hypothetical protein C4538_01140 [Nitrospiraceae bacterium]|nr:MAG: hypothetical protein C4538_01140 [Nitrospiraceae bacterium]